MSMGMGMRHGWEGAKGTDLPAASQKSACPRSQLVYGLGDCFVNRAHRDYSIIGASRPDQSATGNSFGRWLINTCHYSNRPTSECLSKGGTRAGACKFLSATLGRPRNLDQKLIALLGTGIISHPQASMAAAPDTPT